MRNSILETIMRQLDAEALTKLSQQVGMTEDQARQGLSAAIPLLLIALEGNTARSGGAEDLKRALQFDHDGSILDNMSAYLSNPQRASGSGILKHVLGDRRSVAESDLARQTGLPPGSLSSLLELAAPLVMGALGKQQRESGLGARMLGSHLAAQRQASQPAGAMMSIVRDLLDSIDEDDGDDDGGTMQDFTDMTNKASL